MIKRMWNSVVVLYFDHIFRVTFEQVLLHHDRMIGY